MREMRSSYLPVQIERVRDVGIAVCRAFETVQDAAHHKRVRKLCPVDVQFPRVHDEEVLQCFMVSNVTLDASYRFQLADH